MNEYSTVWGLDLGDKRSVFCRLDEHGKVVERGKVATSSAAMWRKFEGAAPCRIVVEAGGQSWWVSRLLEGCGHEVVVANPRQVRLISASTRKSDAVDAETLARLGRVDPTLLHPIEHRGEAAQTHLAVLRARDAAVGGRTALINSVRGLAKSFGIRLPKCSAPAFHKKVAEEIPEALRPALMPLLEAIGMLTEQIRTYAAEIERLASEAYPETEMLRSVPGVGPITALAFVLTLDVPERFARSRDVPAYLGLVPRRSQSGEQDPHLRITKTGNALVRRLLVQCAHYILGPHGPDTRLRRWGLQLAGGGTSKRAKRRAIVAVARKLGVLLHRLWVTGEVYESFPDGLDKAEAA
jgi:transposase